MELKVWCCRLQRGQESGETRETTREFQVCQLDNTTILLCLSPLLRPVMDRVGRVAANAVSHCGGQGQYQAKSCGYSGGQSDSVTGPYPNTSAFSFQYRSTTATHPFTRLSPTSYSKSY